MFHDFQKLLVLIVILTFSGSASAQVYRWVDEEGNIHYGDSPPENVDAIRIEIDTQPSRQAPSSNTKLLQDAKQRYQRLAEEREARDAERQLVDAVQQEADQRCTYLRKQLISLQQKLPVYRDEDGKYRTLSKYDAYEGKRDYIDDATRAHEIVRIYEEMTRVCKDPANSGEQFMAGWERMEEKRCEHARLSLKEVQSDRRSPRQAIEDAQAKVDLYCGQSH